MNIKIKAPIIIVPVHSQSLEAIVVDLGNLTITNKITNINVESEHSPAVIDEMKVDLSNVKLSKVLLSREEGADNSMVSRFGSLGSFVNCQMIFENPQFEIFMSHRYGL